MRTPVVLRVAKKAGMGLAIAAIPLTIAEVALRLALGPDPLTEQSPLYASAETIGFKVAPNLRFEGLQTNSRGFRSPELDANATRRILVLGDSMVFGAVVRDDETFCSILERRLGPGCQVVNAGCPGYGPWEEGIQLETEGPSVKPTDVVVCFFTGNDFQDAGRDSPMYRVIGGRLVARSRYDETPLVQRAFRNLLAQTWSFGLVRAVRSLGAPQAETRAPVDGPLGMDSPQIRCILELDDYSQTSERGDRSVADGWLRMESHFERIRCACEGLRTTLTVVILPLPIVFDRDLRVRLAQRWNVGPNSIDAERPSRTIRGLFDRLRIRVIDLTGDLRDHPRQGALHLVGDMHFSAEGHAAVASLLASRL